MGGRENLITDVNLTSALEFLIVTNNSEKQAGKSAGD